MEKTLLMKFRSRFILGSIFLLLSLNIFASNRTGLNFNYQNVTPYSATLKWNELGKSEIQSYKIYCNDKLLFTTPKKEFFHNSLVPNQTYKFTVKALDKYNNSIDAANILIKTLNSNKSNFFLLNYYPFKNLGAEVNYYDGVIEAVNELFPNSIEYYKKYKDPQRWYSFYNIKSRKPYKTEIRNNINFNFYEDGVREILNSDKDKFAAMTFEGFLVVGETGEYTFKTEHDNSFILELDNNEVINVMKFKVRDDHTIKKIKLFAGIHRIKITYYEFSGVKSTLLMQWSGPNFNFQPLDGYSFIQLNNGVKNYLNADSDFDGVLDSLENQTGSSCTSWDTDGDGLTDYEEIMRFNSLPNKADSDNDGILDGIEAKILHTNITKKDNKNNFNSFSNVKTVVKYDKLDITWDFTNKPAPKFTIYRNFKKIGSTFSSKFSLPIFSENDLFYIVAHENKRTTNYTKIGPLKLTSEQKEYLQWKETNKLPNTSTFEADSDHDKRNKYQEFKLDSNPNVAPLTTINNLKKYKGLSATYYNTMWSPKSLNNLDAFKIGIIKNINFNAGENEVLDSGKKNAVGILFKGYFETRKTGIYKFLTAYDDSIRIFIDGIKVFEGSYWNPVGRIWQTHLSKGIHSIKIEYTEVTGAAMLDFKWAPPGENLQAISEDIFWHVKNNQQQLDEYITWDKDSDNDKLSNKLELEYGTNTHKIDTDNDGISDYEEIYKYKTSPTYADSDGDNISDGDEVFIFNSNPRKASVKIEKFMEIQNFKGSEFSKSLGNWNKKNKNAVSNCTIGAVTYSFSNKKANVYKLILKAQLSKRRNYKINIKCDNVLIAAKSYVYLPNDKEIIIEAFMPFLQPGKHSIEIFFDNPNIANKLIIKELKIFKIVNNSNKWLKQYAKNMSKLNKIPKISKISPIIIQGKNKFARLIKINNENVNDFNSNQWYKELTLNPDNNKNIFNFEFQNNLQRIPQKIKWETTNVMAQKNNISLKKGDSLLLDIIPINNDKNIKNVELIINNQIFEIAKPLAFKFSKEGSFCIKGSYLSQDNKLIKNKFIVTVKNYNFKQNPITMTTGSYAQFNISPLPPKTYLEASGNVKFILNNKTNLMIDCQEWNKKQVIMLKSKINNRILAVLPINILRFYGGKNTAFYVAKTLDNGIQILELHSICYPIKPYYSIEFETYLSGLTFENNSRKKTLYGAQFDETGTGKLRFIKNPESTKTQTGLHAVLKIDDEVIQQLY